VTGIEKKAAEDFVTQIREPRPKALCGITWFFEHAAAMYRALHVPPADFDRRLQPRNAGDAEPLGQPELARRRTK
jgi:hypothetical protein